MEYEENGTWKFWLFAAMNGLVVLLLLLTAGCLDLVDVENEQGTSDPEVDPDDDDQTGQEEEPLRADPVVKVTEHDYTGDPYSLPYGEVHDLFASVYNGSDLSKELRDDLIDSMEELAVDLEENGTILGYCIEETYEDMTTRPHRIPTYAEKCTYSEEDVWAIAFNRCNGFQDAIGHFDVFFVSIDTITTMHQSGCNSTFDPILGHFGCY